LNEKSRCQRAYWVQGAFSRRLTFFKKCVINEEKKKVGRRWEGGGKEVGRWWEGGGKVVGRWKRGGTEAKRRREGGRWEGRREGSFSKPHTII
jgi:hypothetical protein